jgi:hypothetical protein
MAAFLAVLTLWILIRPAPPDVTEEVVTVRTTKKNPTTPRSTPVPTATPVPTRTPVPTPSPTPKPGKRSTPAPGAPAATPNAGAGDVGDLFAPEPTVTPTPAPFGFPLPATR